MQQGVATHGFKAQEAVEVAHVRASVQFALQHNVVGRNIYAEGTADAVRFLAKKIAAGAEAKVYTMVNVLEEGALE